MKPLSFLGKPVGGKLSNDIKLIRDMICPLFPLIRPVGLMLNLPAALGKILPDMVEPVFSAEDDLPSSEMKTNNVEWPSSMPPHLTVPSRWNVAGIDFCNLNGMATSPYWSECILIESLNYQDRKSVV